MTIGAARLQAGANAWQRKKSACALTAHDPLPIVLRDGVQRGEPDDPRRVDDVVARQTRGVDEPGAVGGIGHVADDLLGARVGAMASPRLVAVGRDDARTALEQHERRRPPDSARRPRDDCASTCEPRGPAHRWSARSTRLPSRFVSPTR